MSDISVEDATLGERNQLHMAGSEIALGYGFLQSSSSVGLSSLWALNPVIANLASQMP
jgi:hypothetical protein